MIYYKFFRIISKFVITFLLIVYLILPLIFITTLHTSIAQDDLNVNNNSMSEEDVLSIGLKWAYHRPDNKPSGNATSWKLRWSPDGSRIAVVFYDNTTVILDAQSGKAIKAIGTSAQAIMSDKEDSNKNGDMRSRINSGVDGSRCWGFTTKPTVPLLRACTWSPNGKHLAISGDHRLIEIYNTSTWVREKVLKGHLGSVLSLDWSPNGNMIASGEGTDQILPHNQAECKNYIKIWDVNTGSLIHTLQGHKDGVISVKWSKNSSRLMSASDDRNLKMWDVGNGTLIYTLGEGVGHSAGVLDVDWSPNQTLLVSGSRDFKVRLWDARVGTPLGKPWKDHNCVRSTHWHPNGKFILTAGVDQTIKIRNATTGKEVRILTEAEDTNSEVMSARWSPDGRSIAACSSRDSTVRLYTTGIADIETSTFDWVIGVSLFLIICSIGLFIIYFPLRSELRERRK